jgi:uncharacterized Zn finger protein
MNIWKKNNEETFDEDVFREECDNCGGTGEVIDDFYYDDIEDAEDDDDPYMENCYKCEGYGFVDADHRKKIYVEQVKIDISRIENSCPHFYEKRREEIEKYLNELEI